MGRGRRSTSLKNQHIKAFGVWQCTIVIDDKNPSQQEVIIVLSPFPICRHTLFFIIKSDYCYQTAIHRDTLVALRLARHF